VMEHRSSAETTLDNASAARASGERRILTIVEWRLQRRQSSQLRRSKQIVEWA